MDNLITKTIVVTNAVYILLTILEVINHPAVLTGAILGVVLFGIVASAFLSIHEHAVHTGEMVLVWTMILLFVFYGVCCWFGVIPWI
jgi:hypothetical protein